MSSPIQRSAAAFTGLLLAFTLTLPARGEETQRYLVATKRARAAGGIDAAMRATAPGRVRAARVRGFDAFRGFAADLTSAEVAALRASGEVRWIEPVVERTALETRNHSGQTVTYGMKLIKAPAVWPVSRSGQVNVVVADSGVDYTHPDLAPLWAGGASMLNGVTDPMDDNGHGSHVSGIVAAANNGFGVAGVAGVPGVRLWGLKVLNAAGKGTSESVLKSIDWVITRQQQLGGRWVVNYSLGSAVPSSAEREAVARAIAAGIVIVGASGNESTPELPAPVVYPGAYTGVVTVGAIDRNSAIGSFSNQGTELDVVAPGVSVLSTVPLGTGSKASVTSGSSIYDSSPVSGSPKGTFTGEFVFCGLGNPSDFPASVAGRIALIQRGELRFAEKARNAKQAGAAAVAIYNNKDDQIDTWTLINEDDPTASTYAWPLTLALSQQDGEAIRARGGSISLSYGPDDYSEMSGTSMASPHVAGAIAMLWALAPAASPQTLLTTLYATARDLGTAGLDTVYGWGVIDVEAAARQLAPSAFDGVYDPVRPTTGRRVLRRGHR